MRLPPCRFAVGAGVKSTMRFALMRGAELATISPSSIQQASTLVPDYGSLMAWRGVAGCLRWCAGLPSGPRLSARTAVTVSKPLCWCCLRGVKSVAGVFCKPAYDGRHGYRQLI